MGSFFESLEPFLFVLKKLFAMVIYCFAGLADHVLHMQGGIMITPILTPLYLGSTVQEDHFLHMRGSMVSTLIFSPLNLGPPVQEDHILHMRGGIMSAPIFTPLYLGPPV